MLPNYLQMIFIIILLVAVVGWSIYLLTCTQIIYISVGTAPRAFFTQKIRAASVHPCHYRRQYQHIIS